MANPRRNVKTVCGKPLCGSSTDAGASNDDQFLKFEPPYTDAGLCQLMRTTAVAGLTPTAPLAVPEALKRSVSPDP